MQVHASGRNVWAHVWVHVWVHVGVHVGVNVLLHVGACRFVPRVVLYWQTPTIGACMLACTLVHGTVHMCLTSMLAPSMHADPVMCLWRVLQELLSNLFH